MIKIVENKPTKLPGISSLYITFDYSQQIVEIIKSSGTANYDKKTTTWEIPVTSLSTIISQLCEIDDIDLKLMSIKQKENNLECDPSRFKTKPYQYQIDGINYGLNHKKWLLLDAPGLGKSLQMLYLAQELKKKEHIEHCLIICGVNSLKSNWEREIKKHTKLSCTILGQKTTKNSKTCIGSVAERLDQLKHKISEFFVITNIETLRNNDIAKEINNSKINNFDMIVLDECHAAKSPTSQQGKNLLKLNKAKYKIGLTGTLLLNNPLDAYVPLKWIGAENSNYTNYKYYYCVYGGPFRNILTGFRNTNVLKEQLEQFSLRRTKDLLDLPEKTIIDEIIDMNPSQQQFYDNITNGIISQADKVNITTTSLLAMVTRLRQATACPNILSSENIESSKIQRAVELSNDIVSNGNKVVIFSTFKETAKELFKQLSEFKPLLCTGDDKENIINDNILKFQNSQDNKILIATWQKMGTGITLTAANYMIFIDTPWTDGVYQQAQDRIHRIGTKNKVFIYNLICKDTIDERVHQIVQAKQAISEYIIDDKINQNIIDNLRNYIEELQ